MSGGVSPGYATIISGKEPLPLFCHFAAFLSVPARLSVGVVCVEHTPDAVMSEIISCVGGIPPHYLRERKVPPPLFGTLNIALSRIYKARLCFSNPIATDTKSVNSLARWLKRRYGIKVLMIDSIEALTNAPADRTIVLRAIGQLQGIAENLGLRLVATCRTGSIYKPLQKGVFIDADGYEWR
jgi:replicative DNA helicase